MKKKALAAFCIFALIIFLSSCQAQYKVTFNIGEGNTTSQIVKKGECIKDPLPTKEGFDFLGWYYNDEPFDVNTGIKRNMTLNAKWSPIDCTVSFYVDEENVTVVNYEYNNNVKEIEEPYKEDYIFLGWYLEDEKYDFSNLITKDIVLTAKWVKDDEYKPTLKISFNSTGAKVEIDDITVNRLDEYENLPVVTRDGYTFLGWYVNDELVNNGDIIKEIKDFTLIAKWKINE